jgi:hypothetical protein
MTWLDWIGGSCVLLCLLLCFVINPSKTFAIFGWATALIWFLHCMLFKYQ